ncbi:protein of unknown function [Paenibacillus alvei]|uniref:Uncharacterized protein n=1 Tax=Paenibacillus alvei TaxID=44250 RepID=A0A383RGI4_PAEAL|nr:protein of unknown function [Paenibacillus alvei]
MVDVRIITLVILLLLTGCMEKSTPERFNPNVRVKTVVPEEGTIDLKKGAGKTKAGSAYGRQEAVSGTGECRTATKSRADDGRQGMGTESLISRCARAFEG